MLSPVPMNRLTPGRRRLRFRCAALLVILALPLANTEPLLHGAEHEGVVQRAQLYWRNGDSLDGELTSANVGELSWKSDAFQNPLRLRLDALHMIRFPTKSRSFHTDNGITSQVIETRDGNRFFGRVTASTNEVVVVDTDLFGVVRLQRSAVSLIANPVERAHVYSGPKGLRGWSTLTYGRKLSEWEEIPSGRLTTRMVAAEIYRALPANGSVDIDIEFLWRHNLYTLWADPSN